MHVRALTSLLFLGGCQVPATIAPTPQDRPIVPEVPAPAGLRFTVEPAAAAPGTTITLMLSNGTTHQIGYNLCDSGLEQQQDGSWRRVPHEVVCTQELRLLMPGQTARYQRNLPSSLGAGRYRFRTGVETPLNRDKPGLDRIASEPFTVRR